MYVKFEFPMGYLNMLYSHCWDGAQDTIKQVEKEGKTTDFVFLLEQHFWEKFPTMGEVNDFIWFDVPEILNLYEEED